MKHYYVFTTIVLWLCTMAFTQSAAQDNVFSAEEQQTYYEITGKSPAVEMAAAHERKGLPIATLWRNIPEEGVLLVPQSALNTIMALNAETGELIETYYFPEDSENLSTPIHLIDRQGTFLVTDQVKKLVQEFDDEGEFIGTFAPAGGLDETILHNIRGAMLRDNGNLLVTVAGGSNADAIAEFDNEGNYIGNFIDNGAGGLDGPWDILYRPDFNDYLVTANGSSGIHRYDDEGNFLEMFGPTMSFPEQMYLMGNGNILVANFLGASGVFELDSEGNQVGYYDVVSGLRGVFELPGGDILVTNSSGVHKINRDNQNLGTMVEGQARFITLVKPAVFSISFDSPVNIPEGETADLGDYLNIMLGTPPFSYSWSLAGNTWESSDENPAFTFDEAGDYLFQLEMIDDEEITASAELAVFAYEELFAHAGDHQYVQTEHVAVLGAETVSTGGVEPHAFLWTLEDSDWTDESSHPEVSFEEKGEYHFTLTVTDAEGNSADDEVSLTVYDELTADAGADITVLENQEFTLGGDPVAHEGVAPYSYAWTLEDDDWTSDEANPAVSLPDAGIYIFHVSVTDALENTAESHVSVEVEVDTTPVSEVEQQEVVVYPNPAYDVLSIRLPAEAQGTMVITDAAGREMVRQTVNSGRITLNVEGWDSGIYILRLGSNEHKFLVR